MNLIPLFLAGVAAPQSIELTVYNVNFGLVKEIRTFDLRSGRQELRVEDVAAYIDPTSVGMKVMRGNAIDILEQNYQYDLISTSTILIKSIGKRIRLRQLLDDGRDLVTEGVLLAAPGQVVAADGGGRMTYTGLVLRTDDGRIILSPAGTIEVLEMPEGLISKPTLMWDLFAEQGGSRDIELTYLTNNINWSADYVMILDADDKKADVNGWVTMNNQSGTTYTNATLKLIAGDVRRVTQSRGGGFGGGAPEAAAMMRRDALGFQEESFFEYHLYTLGRPATVRNNEQKQISLLNVAGIDVYKDMVLEGQRSVWQGSGRDYIPGEGYASDPKVKVNVVVEMTNSDKNGMGMPLPAGKVRVYKRDSKGQVQMIGEDRIDHTPREEKIRLYIGDAFDVVGERTRIAFRRISSNVIEEDFEIKVRNRKKVNETVRVVEHAWSDWRILRESMQSTKKDSNTFEYMVTLKPDEEKVITYTVRTRW
ncbi:MAG: hypothetical protein M3R13_00060 [Armatimonadota bacterium]|nr:hypothetical protein [Armatimonadota bacterium]